MLPKSTLSDGNITSNICPSPSNVPSTILRIINVINYNDQTVKWDGRLET